MKCIKCGRDSMFAKCNKHYETTKKTIEPIKSGERLKESKEFERRYGFMASGVASLILSIGRFGYSILKLVFSILSSIAIKKV